MSVPSIDAAKPSSRWSFLLLAIYDVALAAGALWLGLPMFGSNSGTYATFPPEWVGKLPFESWVPIGCIAIFFAVCNAVAALLCLTSRKHASASLLMGFLLAAGMAMQIIVLKETYLATGEFLFAAFVQIVISATLMIRRRFVATATEHAR